MANIERKLEQVRQRLDEFGPASGDDVVEKIQSYLDRNLPNAEILDVVADVNEGFVDFRAEGDEWRVSGFPELGQGPGVIQFTLENKDSGQKLSNDRGLILNRAFENLNELFDKAGLI